MTISTFTDDVTAGEIPTTLGPPGQVEFNPFPPPNFVSYDTTRLISMQLSIELAKHDESVNVVDAAKSIYKFITGQTVI